MNPVRRRELHGQIAHELAKRGSREPDLRHLSTVALHFRLAHRHREAAEYSEQLGNAAMRASVHTAAVDAYRSAIDHALKVVLPPHDEQALASLSRKLGDAYLAAGDHQRAIDAYTRAENMLAPLGHVVERGRALRRLGTVYARQEQFDQAIAYLGAAIATHQAQDEAGGQSALSNELALTLIELGEIEGTSLGHFDAAIEHGWRGLNLAIERPNQGGTLVAHARLSLAKTLMRAGDLPEGASVLDPALPVALQAGDYDLAAEIAGALANYHYWTGDLGASAQAARQRQQHAQRAGDPFAMRHTSSWLANLALARGEWMEARRLLAESGRQVEHIESPEPQAFLRIISGLVDLQLGNDREAIAQLKEAIAGFRKSGPATVVWYLGCLASACLETNDEVMRQQVVNEVRDLIADLPPRSLPCAPALGQLGIIAARTGDATAARALYQPVQVFHGQHHWVLLDRVLGMLAATLDDWAAAERHFSEATATAVRGGLEPELALTLAEQGCAFLRSPELKHQTVAASILADGVRRLDALDMHTRADYYAGFVPRSQTSSRVLPARLTEREADVLTLLTEGLTNREIGHRLHISEKTVTNHLTHIFTKADLDNRGAAVAFAMRHGLTR